jgi:subtilisin family serine protease
VLFISVKKFRAGDKLFTKLQQELLTAMALVLLHRSLTVVTVLLAVATLSSDARRPKRPLIRAHERERVPDTYFVHIRRDIQLERVQELVQELSRRSSEGGDFRASVASIMTRAVYGLSARFSPEALDYVLREDNIVEFVEEDSVVMAGSDPRRVFYAWGLDRLDQVSNRLDTMYTAPCNLTGDGVDVYVMDTGIHFSHEQFEGRALHAGCDPADVESRNMQQFRQLQLRTSPENMSGWDCVGHGSHVAGIAGGKDYGVAPGINMFSVRVLNCNLTGSWNAIVEGLDCVLEQTQRRKKPTIVNMSLYGEKTRAVKRAIEELLRHNITVVTIAGNNQRRPRDSCRVTPGSVRGAITVAASTRQDRAWSMSNAGLCVDIFAPGEEILSANNDCNTCFEFKSGTSMQHHT